LHVNCTSYNFILPNYSGKHESRGWGHVPPPFAYLYYKAPLQLTDLPSLVCENVIPLKMCPTYFINTSYILEHIPQQTVLFCTETSGTSIHLVASCSKPLLPLPQPHPFCCYPYLILPPEAVTLAMPLPLEMSYHKPWQLEKWIGAMLREYLKPPLLFPILYQSSQVEKQNE